MENKQGTKIEGWKAICACVGWTRPTLIKYGFPVYRQIARGNRVVAYTGELETYKRDIEQRIEYYFDRLRIL